jgi:hypothetical protein
MSESSKTPTKAKVETALGTARGRTERTIMVDPGTVTIIALCAYAGLKVSVVGYAVYAYGCSRASRKNCGRGGGADGDEGEEENQQEEVGRESRGKIGSGKAKEA